MHFIISLYPIVFNVNVTWRLLDDDSNRTAAGFAVQAGCQAEPRAQIQVQLPAGVRRLGG